MFRNGGTHIEFVNNLVAGNWYFLPGVADNPDAHPDRYEMPIKPEFILEQQVQQIDLNVVAGDDPAWVCQSNVICGADVPCLMNIKGALGRMRADGRLDRDIRVMHIAQILDSRG